MSSTVINTKHTETVPCIKHSQDFIKEYESMTLEERLELIDRAYRGIIHGLFGDNYVDV